MGKFKLTQKANKWHFNLLADNNEIIITSEVYDSRAGAENGIESVRENCLRNGAFQIKESNKGQNYFILRASNGQIIGVSQMYASTQSCENGMASVVRNAPLAKLIEV